MADIIERNATCARQLLECAAEIERLRAFVDFANHWAWRDSKLDDTERLSMIKHHPTAKQRREALNEQKGSQG